MSNFGWGAGDLLALIKDLWTVSEAIRRGPANYRDLCRDADSLYRSLEDLKRNVLESDQRWTPKAQARLDSLRAIVDNCSESLGEIWEFLAQNRKIKFPNPPFSEKVRSMVSRYRSGIKNLNDVRLKFISHQQAINTFLQSLNYGTLQQVDQRLTRMEDFSVAGGTRSAPPIQSHFHFHQPQFNYQPNFSAFSSPPPSSGPPHNAICDGCNKTIYGLRYQCNNCADFDYCHNCITGARSTHNPSHQFNLLHGPDEMGKNFSGGRVREITYVEEVPPTQEDISSAKWWPWR